MAEPPRYIDPDERLWTCEKCATYLAWPIPVNRRLDELVDCAREAGHDLNRNDLLAVLVFATPCDGPMLGRLLVRYRRSKAGDAVMGEGPIPVLPRKPGRRPKRPRRM